jgi:hypothetical protein
MRSVLGAVLLGALLLAVSPGRGTAMAQLQTSGQQTTTHPNTPTMPPIDGRTPDPGPGDPLAAMREANRARSIANERQKKIVDDTARLLQLATELKTDVDKSTKDELSLDVIRKADEIEKLAHDVKQRMKG